MPPQYNPRLRRLEEYEQIKRKNRRRLVGALLMAGVAAVLLAKVLGGSENTDAPASITVSDSGAASVPQTQPAVPAPEAVQAAGEDGAAAPQATASVPAETGGQGTVRVSVLPNPLNRQPAGEGSTDPVKPGQAAGAEQPAPARGTAPGTAERLPERDAPVQRSETKPVQTTPEPRRNAESKPAETAQEPRRSTEAKPAESAGRQTAKPNPQQNRRETENAASRRPAREADKPQAAKPSGSLTPEEILNNRAARQAGRSQSDPQAILNGQSSGRTMIQVGAYTSEEQARAVQKRLADAGVSAYVAPSENNGNRLYRVRTGTYASAGAANQALAKIKAQGLDGMLLER